MGKHYVYQYANDKVTLYVGKTDNMIERHKAHKNEKWYHKDVKCLYTTVSNKSDQCLLEIYLINKQDAIHNVKSNYQIQPTFKFKEPLFHEFKESDFIDVNSKEQRIKTNRKPVFEKQEKNKKLSIHKRIHISIPQEICEQIGLESEDQLIWMSDENKEEITIIRKPKSFTEALWGLKKKESQIKVEKVGVQEVISIYKNVTLDASILKAAIDRDIVAGPVVLELLQAIEKGELSAISILTYAQLIGEQKEEYVARRLQLLLNHFPNLMIIFIDVEVANRTVAVQKKAEVTLIDALLLASAQQAGSSCIVSIKENQLELFNI